MITTSNSDVLHRASIIYNFASLNGTYFSPLASSTLFAALTYPSLFCSLLMYSYNLG